MEMGDLDRSGQHNNIIDDWLKPPQAYDNIKLGDIPLEEERVYWNEPDQIVIRKSEFGGVLQKNWESAKDKLCGRFFFPDGNSLVSTFFFIFHVCKFEFKSFRPGMCALAIAFEISILCV